MRKNNNLPNCMILQKDLDGNPSDLTVGAAAVGLMHNAVWPFANKNLK